MKYVVYGGHYGSEGKGSLAEFLSSKLLADHPPKRLIVAGENAPNSGHTCSRGKTRNIPASSFWANAVLLGPDSVIDPECLAEDVAAINVDCVGSDSRPVYIHEAAALMGPIDKTAEVENGLVGRISSTGSGSGAARWRKQYMRGAGAIVRTHSATIMGIHPAIRVVNSSQYLSFISQHKSCNWIFECSQGSLLDVNFGIFPYVTSRSTLPRVAIERNGLGSLTWEYCGVYRTYPIRTGGPSGPTGGKEIKLADIGLPDEITSVTKRVRRVFEFSAEDFMRSIILTRPDRIAFTHLDYLRIEPYCYDGVIEWLDRMGVNVADSVLDAVTHVYLSNRLGQFYTHVL